MRGQNGKRKGERRFETRRCSHPRAAEALAEAQATLRIENRALPLIAGSLTS